MSITLKIFDCSSWTSAIGLIYRPAEDSGPYRSKYTAGQRALQIKIYCWTAGPTEGGMIGEEASSLAENLSRKKNLVLVY